MLEQMRRSMVKYGMVRQGDRVVVALSGGPDSVALLHGLRELAEEWELTLVAAHLKHGFRPLEGEEDARFCRDLSFSLGIPYEEEAIDGPRLAAEAGRSPQVVGREARYDFFRRVARKHGASRIALGHQADDQGETILMRLLRGSGIPALGGMFPVRDAIIRPLIEVSREQILRFLEERRLTWREDSSNAKPIYLRNRIRRDILPLLKEENPGILRALARTGTLLREDGLLLEKLAQEAWERCRKGEGALDRELFLSLPPSLRRRVFRMAFEEWAEESLDFDHGEEALGLIEGGGGGRLLQLPRGVWVTCDRGSIAFVRDLPAKVEEYRFDVPIPGRLELQDGVLISRWLAEGEEVAPSELNLLLHEDTLAQGPLQVRNRRPGDRFSPSGMGGSKKLKDYFIDGKVPRSLRDRIPLLVQGERILWVIGLRKSREAGWSKDSGGKGRRALLEWLPKRDSI